MQFELTHLVDALPGLGWTALPDGRAEFLNRRWLDYTGMTAQQAAGTGWAEAIHPDDRKRLAEYWQSCVASGSPVDIEARLRRHDASYRWFVFRANPLRDGNGKVSRWFGTNFDIEERKRGEESLRASELNWRQIVDNIPGFVATLGAGGEVEFLNRQILEYFGKTKEDLENWSLIGVVHPDDLARVIEARTRSIETGQIYDIEHRCRRADGVYRWFQVRGLPVRDAEGAVTSWNLLLTDIDDLKKAEEALRLKERDLSILIDVMPTNIFVLRTDGSVEYVNRGVLEYFGITLEDAQRVDFRARYFHPEDVARLREERQAALVLPEPFENEQRALRRDGEYRWFLGRYSPLLDERGRIERWYVAAFDIEDRKRAEAQVQRAYLRLAEAQQLSKTGSFITDLAADDHNWSEEAFRIFDVDPATRITVGLVREMVHPDDVYLFDSIIARAVAGEDVDFGFRIVTARGAVKHLRGVARVMEQTAGHPLFIGALQDVTENMAAEEALNRARSELAHVSRATTLNTLTASIAHEVNQPLSGIITNASTCLRMLSGDPPNVDGALETARRTIRDGQRASEVITRLRTLFTRKVFTLESLDLNEAVREIIALTLSDLQRNRVALRYELADDLPPVVGDRVQLQQVMLNLLRNASDAMTGVDDRPRELLVRTDTDPGARVRLSVRDAGVGFKPEARDKLFDAFYTTKKDGMGIGLSVSRSIIEAHHGRLWATANDGPGATFSFSIPCTREPAQSVDGAGAGLAGVGAAAEPI